MSNSSICSLKRVRDESYSSSSSSPHTETAPASVQCQQPSSDGTLKFKRPRTERYHLELQRFKNVQRTFEFFQSGLGGKELGERQRPIPQDRNKQLLNRNLIQRSMMNECEFQNRCRTWMDEAQGRLDLKDSIAIIRRGIFEVNNGKDEEHQRMQSPVICLLNQGKETTEAIIESIAEYAGGVPSDCEVVDCYDLICSVTQRR